MTYRPKLIEVALPLEAINLASAKEKSIRHGHPSTLHLWWARRPLAACRAVLFGQLVDDPSGWPEEFPTEEAQDKERERLFDIIRDLVIWENSNNAEVLYKARLAIARTFARRDRYAAMAEGIDSDNLIEMMDRPPRDDVNKYLAERVPPVHDPFAGGGSIPLEAQRLGLRAIATDLNPVAVLINKALIEIPIRFSGTRPVAPLAARRIESWMGASGLAHDVDYFATEARREAWNEIGHHYPRMAVTKEMARERSELRALVGEELTVIAWLWARTVPSPNPAASGRDVPLISSYWLSKKPGRETVLLPIVDRDAGSWRFTVAIGPPADRGVVDQGTKIGRGGQFLCLLTGTPISEAYVREQAAAGRMGNKLLCVVTEGKRGRIYLPATQEQENLATSAMPTWAPDEPMATNARWFSPPVYGLKLFAQIFTPRQLLALNAFSDAARRAAGTAESAALAAGWPRGEPLAAGGSGARAYGEAISVYLAFAVDRSADYWSTIAGWHSGAKMEALRNTFGRQAIPMTWDFAEGNPFSDSSGNWLNNVEWIVRVLRHAPLGPEGCAAQASALRSPVSHSVITATDPPYYDNIGYADLSDFFFVWLRKNLKGVFPQLFETMLVPKAEELVATPARFGGSTTDARDFFERGLGAVFQRIAAVLPDGEIATVFYAFKQAESGSEEGGPEGHSGASSTGWETMLHALVTAGFAVSGTWPMRTEMGNRMVGMGTNALASSIVLCCRKRAPEAGVITRAEFRRLLRNELPAALRHLQHGNIAPVDVAQAAIGPGMGIFSRHAKILEADGRPMAVRTALQLINEALDEFLSETEGDLDADTRFAVTWFETHSYDTGLFGEAETLAKARNVSVSGVAEAGILSAAAGKVRLLRRADMPAEWNPATDKHLTVWEATQHLIKRLEERGEGPASDLLRQLGPVADQARALAYRLYSACERRKWAEEARAYNGLVVAWPELERLAAQAGGATPAKPNTPQESLF